MSALLPLLEGAGGVAQEYHGERLVRHFGDPHAEYEAAVKGVAVFDRSHRTRLMVTGRAPAQMLKGTLTGTIPGEPSVDAEGVWSGAGHYQAVLTPKGRMISDAWAFRLGAEEEPGFLLDVPVAGRVGLVDHLAKFLPPRLARVTDASSRTASVSVTGAGAAAVLSRLAFGLRVSAEQLADMAEGAWYAAGSPGESTIVARSYDVWPMAWTAYGPAAAVAALWKALVATGVQPAGLGVWSTLRVEAGRPVYGTDMDDRTIPPEAGIVDRAIDQTKGCYTGQEVIVRIRDRGHVNRELRRLALGDLPVPSPGTPLLSVDGRDAIVGEVTSAVVSPAFDGAIVLAYVRHGVDRVSVGGREVDVPDGFPTPPPATSTR